MILQHFYTQNINELSRKLIRGKLLNPYHLRSYYFKFRFGFFVISNTKSLTDFYIIPHQPKLSSHPQHTINNIRCQRIDRHTSYLFGQFKFNPFPVIELVTETTILQDISYPTLTYDSSDNLTQMNKVLRKGEHPYHHYYYTQPKARVRLGLILFSSSYPTNLLDVYYINRVVKHNQYVSCLCLLDSYIYLGLSIA